MSRKTCRLIEALKAGLLSRAQYNIAHSLVFHSPPDGHYSNTNCRKLAEEWGYKHGQVYKTVRLLKALDLIDYRKSGRGLCIDVSWIKNHWRTKPHYGFRYGVDPIEPTKGEQPNA